MAEKNCKKPTKSKATAQQPKAAGTGWQQSMSVGEKTIDMQHQKLFNELKD